MLDELKQLNDRIYELYGRLYENEELLTKKQTDCIADKLYEAYKQEYAILVLNAEPETSCARFRAKTRRNLLVPYVPGRLARWLLRRRINTSAELILREVRAAAERAFAERIAKLNAVQAEKEEAELPKGAIEQPEKQFAESQAEEAAEQAIPETADAQTEEQPGAQEQQTADRQAVLPKAEQNTGTIPEQAAEHGELNGAERHGSEAVLSLIAESKPSAAQAVGRQDADGAAG